MAAEITGPRVAAQGQPGEVHTTSKNALNSIAYGYGADGTPAEYIYLKGVASTIVGSVVTYDELGVSTLIVANAIGPVAVATAITDATTEFGWYAISGVHEVDTVANSAADVGVGRETTNGKVGDGRAAGDQIANWVQRDATTTAAVVTHQFYRPYVDDFQGA